jgi:STE24 endopeptidase
MVFVGGLVLALELVALPGLAYFESRSRRRHRRGPAAVGEVLAAHAQTSLVTLAVSVAGAAIWSLSVAVGHELWWALAAALLAGMLVIALRLAPALLARLADVKPIARRDLVARLEDLARRSRVALAGVHEWQVSDESDASALVTGAGQMRRVLIASPLLRDWSDDEIAVMVAHELAHHRHHDLHITLLVDALFVGLAAWTADAVLGWAAPALGLGGPADLAALPMLMLVAGAVWTAATPVRHLVSRWQERRADRFALELTNGADAFSAAIRRLSAQHLVEERPSAVARWFFGRHPPVAERLALADAYRRGRVS